MNEAPERQAAGPILRSMSLLAAFGWAIAGALVVPQVGGALARAIQNGAEPDIFSKTLCELFGYTIVIFVVLRLYAPNARLRDALGLRATSPLVVIAAIVTGLAIVPALVPVEAFLSRRFPAPQEELDLVEQLFTASTPGSRVRLAVSAGFLLPIGQELFYRGILFGRLRAGRSMLFAVAATALCEVAATLEPRWMLSAIVPALAFAFLRGATGSVVPAVAAQVAYNIAGIAPILAGLGPNDDPPVAVRWSIAAAATIVVALGAVWWVGGKSEACVAARAQDT